MNIELGILKDGRVLLVTESPLPDIVKRVEFYRDQKLFMLVYDNETEESELMHYEVPDTMAYPVENSPNVLIYSFYPDHEPIGYKVPLIKVGDLY